MRNTLLISWSTLREALARKVFIFFLIISALVLLGLLVIFSLVDIEAITQIVNPGENEFIRKEIVTQLEIMIVSPLASLCLLLSIFASASFVPVMLEKGNIDLLLSKPISRAQLLWGKFWGGTLVVFINIGFLIVGTWLIIAFKFGYWDPSFLWMIFTITFAFAVLYGVIILLGVITAGSTFGMMIAYLIFLILSPLLLLAKAKLNIFFESDFVKTLIEGLYYIFPKTSEILGSVSLDLTAGKGITDFQPLLSSFLFLAVMMFWSISVFKRKDF